MNREEYKEKLRGFNATEKYNFEMGFLYGLLTRNGKPGTVLDYGAGRGVLAEWLRKEKGIHAYCFDIDGELYESDPFYFRTELYFKVQVTYFMHSFAHIPNAPDVLKAVKEKFTLERGELVIITPNLEWLDRQPKEGYRPDPTVHQHYTLASLTAMVVGMGWRVLESGTFGWRDPEERIYLRAGA